MTSSERILYKRLRSFSAIRPVRSRVWISWVKSLPCIVCGAEADDAHHIFGSFESLKTSDLFTVPLCRKCHDAVEVNAGVGDLMMECWIEMIHDRYLRPRYEAE